MKKIKLTLLSTIILFLSNSFAQTPEAFKKLDAFEKNEMASILKDTNNTKYINTVVDTLKSLHNQCIKIYEEQSKDPGLKYYNVTALEYKYMALRHLFNLTTQSFFKNKKKEYDFLSSKYNDVQKDVDYAKKNSYKDWEYKMRTEIGQYYFGIIKIAYLSGDMKKQLPFALAIDSMDIYMGRVEKILFSIFIIDGLLKNNKLEGIDSRIETRVTSNIFKSELLRFEEKTLILKEFSVMLAKNKTSVINFDKTGKMSNNIAKFMFDQGLYKNSYELLTEAANAGYDLPRNKIAVLATALGCWRLELLDKATVLQNIDLLKEYNKTTPIGNAGWKVIIDTYTYLGNTIDAEEAKKNIK